MKNKGNYDYNIYHLLNSNEGTTLRRNLIIAKNEYKETGKYYYYYTFYEHETLSCLKTISDCKRLSYDEYKEMFKQILFLMRLYKGYRGSLLERKDVPNE